MAKTTGTVTKRLYINYWNIIMKKLTLLFSLLLASSPGAFAGGGHSHNADGSHSIPSKVDNKAAVKISMQVIKSLIKAKKISGNWGTAKQTSISQKRFSGNLEWVIVYNNSLEKNSRKQNFYVFLSLTGEYLGSNFTGE